MTTFKHPCKPHRRPWQYDAYALLFGAAITAAIVGLSILAFNAFSQALFEAANYEFPLGG